MRISRRNALQSAIGGALAAPLVMRHAALGADPIKVVGIHDASGGLDIYGQPMIACLDFAVDEVNAAGGLLGRQVQLTNYDPQYEGGVCDRNCFCTGSTPAQNVQKLIPYVMQKWGKKLYIIAADYNYG